MYKFVVNFLRLFFVLMDWRRAVRILSNKAKLDVVMVSNFRDQIDVVKFGYRDRPLPNVLPWIRFHWGKVASQLFMIGIMTEELLGREGKRKGQYQFIEAICKPIQEGSKAVMLAANTKRLFGKDAGKLREEFPGIVFTIGDNCTSLLLCQEVERTIAKTGLKVPRILVIGPTGHLGSSVVAWARSNGYEVIGLGSDEKRARVAEKELGIPIAIRFDQIGKVDVVVACTHIEESRLSSKNVDLLRKFERKLAVVDVCEPPNMSEDVYQSCSGRVVRVDAGNAYSRKLKYVLGWFGWSVLRLKYRMVWGCFAEAMIIAKHLDDPQVASADWMEVSEKNKEIIKKYLGTDFNISPEPLCFGKPIRNFNLDLLDL